MTDTDQVAEEKEEDEESAEDETEVEKIQTTFFLVFLSKWKLKDLPL